MFESLSLMSKSKTLLFWDQEKGKQQQIRERGLKNLYNNKRENCGKNVLYIVYIIKHAFKDSNEIVSLILTIHWFYGQVNNGCSGKLKQKTQ